MMAGVEVEFRAPLWEWDARRTDTWTFVSLPLEVADDVLEVASSRGAERGFGSVRVEVRVGTTTWRTSLFPDSKSGTYVLPVKKAVRAAEGLATGDELAVRLRLLDV